MNAADVLDAAADYIEEHGWTRGPSLGGATCAFLAIVRATPDDLHQRSLACRALENDLGGDILTAWNDAQDSAELVLKQLRATAQRLRAEQ